MRVRDVEPHVRRVRTSDRTRIPHWPWRPLCRAARVRMNRRRAPTPSPRRRWREAHRAPASGRHPRVRPVDREPVHPATASMQLRAVPGDHLAQRPASIISLARSGSAIAHSILLARRYVNRACSSSLSSATETSATTSSASWPRPSHDSACARMNIASVPPPARPAASASRSASARSPGNRAPRGPQEQVTSGSRSESRLNAPRRTTTRTSSRFSAGASSRPTHPAAGAAASARQFFDAPPRTAGAPPGPRLGVDSSSLIRPRSVGLLDRFRGADPRSAANSMAHRRPAHPRRRRPRRTEPPIRDSISSTSPCGTAGSPSTASYLCASPDACPRLPARRCGADTGCCPRQIPQAAAVSGSSDPANVADSSLV